MKVISTSSELCRYTVSNIGLVYFIVSSPLRRHRPYSLNSPVTAPAPAGVEVTPGRKVGGPISIEKDPTPREGGT